MERTENEVNRIIHQYKPIINHPYWIYRNDIKKICSQGSQNAIQVGAIKDVMVSSLKLDFSSASNNAITGLVNTLLLYGVHKYFNYLENKNSEYIVQLYLLATIYCNRFEGDRINLIDAIASDLVGMSSLKFSIIANNTIGSTTIEVLKGFFDDSYSNRYISRQQDYIYLNVRNRIVAYLTNISIIENLANSQKFKELTERYKFDSYYDLMKFRTSFDSSEFVKIENLTSTIGSYRKQQNYIRNIKTNYDEIFTEIGNDVSY